jgi:hypothetical protein
MKVSIRKKYLKNYIHKSKCKNISQNTHPKVIKFYNSIEKIFFELIKKGKIKSKDDIMHLTFFIINKINEEKQRRYYKSLSILKKINLLKK